MAATTPKFFLRPLYWAIWRSRGRRSRKLLQFAAVEASGGRDLIRAAELTEDARLRHCFLAHARDEERHARLFRARGLALSERSGDERGSLLDRVGAGERGLEGLRVEDEDMPSLLAFIHLSERAAAGEFATYRTVLGHDRQTKALFERILRDEEGHMTYALAELKRVAPSTSRKALWKARLRRIWRAYLRFATGLADIIASFLLTLQYFVLIPPFALAAKLAARREPRGWHPIERGAAS